MRGLVLLLILLLTGCSGLPQPREMGDMALLRTVGVDRAQGELSVTVSTGRRAKGLQGEGQPALILTTRADSFSGAALALQKQGEDYVFFGYADQLLVGEELARQDVRPVLDYFARDRELGLGARLWVIRENGAEQAIRSGGENGVEERLATLRTDGELGVSARTRTAGEVYTDLLERGSAWVPALAVEEDALVQDGYAVLRGNALVGFLDGEEAKGLELLNGQPGQDILELEVGGQRVAVWIRGATNRYRLTEEGVAVDCRIRAQVVEFEHGLTESEREQLQETIRAREQERMAATVERLQQWGADCLGLGPRAGVLRPGLWQEWREPWQRLFGGLEIQMKTTVELPKLPAVG